MHPIEDNILAQLKSNQGIKFRDRDKLNLLPLGTLSREFYSDSCVKQYCENGHHHARELSLRIALEEYIASDHSQQYFENIETAILQLPSPMSSLSKGLQSKAAGTYLIPVSSGLIRQIYQLEDIPLIQLFQKHFPVPPAQLFGEDRVPNVIQKRDIAVLETMKKTDLKVLEPFIIQVQRRIRMKQRYQEEVNRIAQRDEFHLKNHHKPIEELDSSEESNEPPPQIHQWAEELLQDANTPYRPKCTSELSDRIMAAARKVSAFSTVKHITSETALQSIFDEALYGRRTLMDFYLAFNPAALHGSDILNGDANVVCLGPQDIDPIAKGGIIIEFDLPKLIQNKPSAFYKQRDLEYQVDKIRQVQLGNETISFDHTGFVRCADPTSTYLKIVDGRGALKHIASAPKSSFIAYNLEQMHEILTLNFFRFMDRMTDLDSKIDQTYFDNFYQKIDQLTDEELVLFLTDLEKNMTDTAEFNFYGAHQIDFSTIINISARYKGYTLHLPKFINALNQGNVDELRQARVKIPELFQSYRFLDYLLLKVQCSDARYYLDDLRKQCKTPNWLQYTPLLVPEGFELRWEVRSESDIREQQTLVVTNTEKETSTVGSLFEPNKQATTVVHEGTEAVSTTFGSSLLLAGIFAKKNKPQNEGDLLTQPTLT